MEDKDKTNIFNGKQELFFAEIGDNIFKKLPIVDDSVSFETDDIKVGEMIEVPYTSGFYKVDLSDGEFDSSMLDKIFGVGEPQHNVIVRPVQIKFRPDPLRKPSNLKYPHKRRKIRVLKKWCKRYGSKSPASIFIKNATITTELDPQTFAIRCHISSKD